MRRYVAGAMLSGAPGRSEQRYDVMTTRDWTWDMTLPRATSHEDTSYTNMGKGGRAGAMGPWHHGLWAVG